MTNLKHHLPISFWICLVFTISLLVGGFFCPPMGEIDGSVLTAAGILFLWPTLATIHHTIEKGSDIQVSKGDLNIKIDNPDNQDNPDAKSQF